MHPLRDLGRYLKIPSGSGRRTRQTEHGLILELQGADDDVDNGGPYQHAVLLIPRDPCLHVHRVRSSGLGRQPTLRVSHDLLLVVVRLGLGPLQRLLDCLHKARCGIFHLGESDLIFNLAPNLHSYALHCVAMRQGIKAHLETDERDGLIRQTLEILGSHRMFAATALIVIAVRLHRVRYGRNEVPQEALC